MSNPYQKPPYLSDTEKSNCYATNRGWVILKPHGKYDVVESIAGLDAKIQAWHDANEVEFVKQEVKEEHVPALNKVNKSLVSETFAQLEEVKKELEIVEAKIQEIIPVLKEEVKSEIVKPKKSKKEDKAVVAPVVNEVSEERKFVHIELGEVSLEEAHEIVKQIVIDRSTEENTGE